MNCSKLERLETAAKQRGESHPPRRATFFAGRVPPLAGDGKSPPLADAADSQKADAASRAFLADQAAC